MWTLEEIAPFDADLWKHLLAQASPDLRREAVRALITLKVPQAEAGPLLRQSLAGETAWSVRFEVLGYFCLADGPVAASDLSWLKAWSATPAKTTKVKGQKGSGGSSGEFLALDGSYQRAFQDFLLMLADRLPQLLSGNERRRDHRRVHLQQRLGCRGLPADRSTRTADSEEQDHRDLFQAEKPHA
jgi:hypothetical protein